MSENQPWHLESFVDALVVELDKTRETLGVKAVNKALSYTVKDLAMDLQIFPTYDGRQVQFVTAQPGEEGSSTITLQLSPITDRQVRESTKAPAGPADVSLDEVDIDDDVRHELRRVGVRSVEDLRRIEERRIDLGSVVDKKISFQDLAERIRSARRAQHPPRVRSASVDRIADGVDRVDLRGSDLAVDPGFEPVAVINDRVVRLRSSGAEAMSLECPAGVLHDGDNNLVMVLDPHAVVRVTVRHRTPERTS